MSAKDAPNGQDEAAKQRIIKHMNADHQDSVARYLEHHHSISPLFSRAAHLTDISLSSMTICTYLRTFTIPLTPPLTTYREARERLVAMDTAAITALHRSPITIKTYVPPHGFHAVLFWTVLLAFVFLHDRRKLMEGGLWMRTVGGVAPGFVRFAARVQPVVLPLMVGIHAGEAGWMVWSRERVHSVRVFSGVWWCWTVGTFFEGFGAFQRFDELVDKTRIAKERQKH